MKRLTRYVLWELCTTFVVTLTAVSLLLVVGGVVRESVRQGLGLGPVLRMIPYIVPEALRVAVPATVLLAACSVYGRMAADNEVVAVKSLGIHPQALLTPALAFSFILSVVALWLNDVAVTWGRTGMYRVVMESLEQIVYGMLRTQNYYTTRRFAISVKDVVGRKLIEPHIAIYPADDQPPITISARVAELRADPQEKTLNILLTRGVFERGSTSFEFPDTLEHVIPLADVHRKGIPVRRASDCPMYQISQQRQEEKRRIGTLRRELAERAVWQLLSGRMRQLQSEAWTTDLVELAAAEDRLHRLTLEPWRRWANGFSCFCFVFVGAPLAVRMRSANFFTVFAACFLPILFVYYPLMAYGVDRAKGGAVPPFTVWLGNVVLLAAGAWLLRRVHRY